MSKPVMRMLVALTLVSSFVGRARADVYQPKSDLAWASFRNLSEAAYEKKLDEYEAKGYLPVDVDIETSTGARRYSVVFRTNPVKLAWGVHTKLDDDGYHAKWEEYRGKGYLPVDVETYVLDGKLHYGGIWHKNADGREWSSRRKLGGDEFHAYFEEMKEKKFRPIDVDGLSWNGEVLFSGVWVKNVEGLDWRIKRNVASADYGALFEDYKKQGLRTYNIDGYVHGGKTYFASIWVKEPRRWAAHRNLDATQFHNFWAKYRDEGQRLERLDTYKTADGVRYAGVWVSDDLDRIDWKHKDFVAGKVKDFCEKKSLGLMGCAVAVYHDGKLRFVRGHGFANQEKGKEAHGGTVFRIASVAKSITATLGFVLADEFPTKLDFSEDIQDALPSIDDDHEYDVETPLLNRTGVKSQLSSSQVLALGTDRRAWSTVDLFDGESFTPGYKYSSVGYTIFAAVLEKKFGKPFCDLLQTHVMGPKAQDLDIRCEDRAIADPERSELYKNATGPASTPDSLHWKYAGGGMESNVVQLARFGARLRQNKILKKALVDKMTTVPSAITDGANYAYGWVPGSTKGAGYYGKTGGQLGSTAYLRAYRDEDLVVAVLANVDIDSKPDDQDLAEAIAKEVLGL